MIAKVEPLTPARALRGPFDYRLPGRMRDVGVGSMLVVPFGHRRLLGVVVELAAESEVPPERLVEPLEALESGVPSDLVRLGLWVADEYCSTPARGLALVLPPGTGTGRTPPVRTRRALSVELAAHDPAAAATPRLGPRQRAVLEAIRDGPALASELTARLGAGHATLRSLERRGLITLSTVEHRRRPHTESVGAAVEPRELTPAQSAALARVEAALDGGGGRLLLHGVTGSGKTEVYIRAVQAALARGRSALVLVPEIALTPQTASRFEHRFGDRVAVLHSRLAQGERYDEWRRLRCGDARVCIGPRSAVFAPVRDLGLVIVDEEHDSSYKQEGDPRYDARHVAGRRAELARAVLLAGSATPRPETRLRLERIALPERVDGSRLPAVDVVGMTGVPGALHPVTREALEDVRRRGEKAIVLLNRRGWSNFLSCRSCGRVWQCPRCDVSLVLHRQAGHVTCHHCGHAERIPRACPECGSVSVARHGIGTERLAAELEHLLAPLPIFRLDADSAAARGGVGRVLAAFERAPAGVLIGTQMVAKGHDFPDVTLGVVLDADATLRFPDFRAEERTFALVAQLAGRSGRSTRGGRVVVQALEPAARALRFAARHDAEGFLDEELARRRALGYPPFSLLIRIVFASTESGRELAAAEAVRARVVESLRSAPFGEHRRGPEEASASDGGGVASRPMSMRVREYAPVATPVTNPVVNPAAAPQTRVLGPAPLFRLKDRDRCQLLVKASVDEPLRSRSVRCIRRAVEAVVAERAHRGVALSVDVDPQ